MRILTYSIYVDTGRTQTMSNDTLNAVQLLFTRKFVSEMT